MKQNTLLLFIFIVFAGGIATGYGLNLLIDPQLSESQAEITRDEEQKASGGSKNENPVSQTISIGSKEMLDDVLPSTSPAWVTVDFQKIRNHSSQFDSFFSSESVQTILGDFVAVMPNGATNTIQYLYENSEWLELFALPPEPNQAYRFAAAFSAPEQIEDASETSENSHPLFEYWKTLYPDVEFTESENGDFTFYTLQTPLGEYTGLNRDGIVWFSNHVQGFPALFSSPLKGNRETPVNPRDEVMQRYPDAVISLHLNGAQEGAAAMALPGMIPQMLTQYGIQQAVFAYQIKPNGVQLSAHAPATSVPSWAQTWSPISSFPFSNEDPMGLLELAFQMPIMSASGITQNNNDGNPLSQSLMSMFPQGSVTGLNLFGFYEGIPSLALRFAEMSEQKHWLQSLPTMSQITSNKIEITQIPAMHYQMKDSPYAKLLGRNELVVMERDAVTYVFDSPIAGKNYFGEINSDPSGKTRRNIIARNGLEQVEVQAQIKGVLTKDWFEQWLVMELKRYQKNPAIYHELEALQYDLQPLITPIHFSAGLREQEWFLDTHAQSADGHLVDLLLLTSMAQSFFPHQ